RSVRPSRCSARPPSLMSQQAAGPPAADKSDHRKGRPLMQPSSRFADLADSCRRLPPGVVLVLGSGMGSVAQQMTVAVRVPFAEIPGLPAASVHGHRGCLTLGEWSGRRVLLFEGRLHYYEGHPWELVTRPIRLAAELGAKVAVLTNAAGGIADGL